MAKEYGTPIAPTILTENLIKELAGHLNWSKSDVIGYCVTKCQDELFAHPRAIRFEEAS